MPDSLTSLLQYGFVDDFTLAIYGGEDTGILQIDGSINLQFNISIRGERIFVTKMNVPYRDLVTIFQYCTAPQDFFVETIEVRVYEDPYYKANVNRRAVDMFELRPVPRETFNQLFNIKEE